MADPPSRAIRRIIVAGATGFIGAALCRALRDCQVTAIVRDAASAAGLGPGIAILPWSAEGSKEWREHFARADAVVNLAGASVGGRRWTAAYKQELRESRIRSTARIVDSLGSMDAERAIRPTLVNASAVGYYGDRGDETVTEETPPGDDFLARVCVDWEAEALKAKDSGTRVVLLRTGIALGHGGALEKMLTPFRLGLGGPLGSGRQWMPWIHADDAVAMIRWAIESEEVEGPLNVTSPNPVTMLEFARTLGRALRRPAILPAPGFALKLLLGEFANSILWGQKALPETAKRLGFAWRYPELGPALRDVLDRRPNRAGTQ